jgi:hypothetical protein
MSGNSSLHFTKMLHSMHELPYAYLLLFLRVKGRRYAIRLDWKASSTWGSKRRSDKRKEDEIGKNPARRKKALA